MMTNKSLQNRIVRMVAMTAAATTLAAGLLTAQPPTPEKTASGETVYRVGQGVTAPRLASKVEPEYTEEARAAKIDGTVLLSVVISPDGVAHEISVVKGLDAGLDVKAVEAVQKWRFEPSTLDGVAVPVRAQIEINFKLK